MARCTEPVFLGLSIPNRGRGPYTWPAASPSMHSVKRASGDMRACTAVSFSNDDRRLAGVVAKGRLQEGRGVSRVSVVQGRRVPSRERMRKLANAMLAAIDTALHRLEHQDDVFAALDDNEGTRREGRLGKPTGVELGAPNGHAAIFVGLKS